MTVTIIYKRLDPRGVLLRRTDSGMVVIADPAAPTTLVSAAEWLAELYDADGWGQPES